jgi:hypothetical protein
MSATSTATSTYSRTQTIIFLTDELLNKLKIIVRESGLSQANYVSEFERNERGIKAWLSSGHFQYLILEIFDKKTGILVKRWDLHVSEDKSGFEGHWSNPDALKYALAKEGKVPGDCDYKVLIQNLPGRPDVDGWVKGESKSTEHLKQSSAGTTATANGFNVKANLYS